MFLRGFVISITSKKSFFPLCSDRAEVQHPAEEEVVSDETETSLTSSMQERPKMPIRLQNAAAPLTLSTSEADTSADFSSINITPERVFKVNFMGQPFIQLSKKMAASLLRQLLIKLQSLETNNTHY